VQVRVKRLTDGVDLGDPATLERFGEQALGRRLPLDKRRGIGPPCALDGEVETIFDWQQLLRELLKRKAMGVLDVALRSLAYIFELSQRTQRLIARRLGLGFGGRNGLLQLLEL
jgi:hypothetical protein